MIPAISRAVAPLLLLIIGLAGFRAVHTMTRPGAEEPAAKPQLIAAVQDAPWIATDEQIMAILQKVIPRKDKVTSNTWLHALRLWGPEAEFNDPEAPSGHTLLSFFLDDRVFQSWAHPGSPPLFSIHGEEVKVRSYDEDYSNRTTSSYHADDIIATFGECGLPLATVIRMRDGETTIDALMSNSMRRFHLDVHEYEWSIISYARYWFPRRQWFNQYGQKITVDDLITELMSHPAENGPCLGLHRLEAAVVLLRADDNVKQSGEDGLTKRQRARLLGYLKAVSQSLVQSQAKDGSWTTQWGHGKDASDLDSATRDRRILATGHHLEWLALAPSEVHPPRETLVRASQWLVHTLIEMDADTIHKSYGPFSHAARALCLWRGKEAYPFWTAHQTHEVAD